jgi:hypothetical protein
MIVSQIQDKRICDLASRGRLPRTTVCEIAEVAEAVEDAEFFTPPQQSSPVGVSRWCQSHSSPRPSLPPRPPGLNGTVPWHGRPRDPARRHANSDAIGLTARRTALAWAGTPAHPAAETNNTGSPHLLMKRNR